MKTTCNAWLEALETRRQFSGELLGTSSVAFGQVDVGASLNTEQTVTLTNRGAASVELGTPTVPSGSGASLDLAGYPTPSALLVIV